ncbi:MAG: hypothetical protein HRT70_09270, partial [Flavobacteriaceae bacterium]|nr:hypothetical protein [Flavobacteriaceae bacterium]
YRKCIREYIKTGVRYISHLAIQVRYSALIIAFWLFIVPVTTQFVQDCLESFSFQKIPYLAAVPVIYLSLILAVALDILIFSLLNRIDKASRLIAISLVVLNCAGAYFVSNKNSKRPVIVKVEQEKGRIKEKIEKLEVAVSKQKAEYLATKWPNQIDPISCEGQVIDCGLPYTSKAQEAFKEYMAVKDLLTTKKKTLAELGNHPQPKEGSSDIFWHIGYYVVIWILLLITIRQKKDHRAYCTTS